MTEARRLLCVLAHPDDESLGVGGILARYAAEGVATYLITATRGEHGWQGDPDANPGPQALGRMREAELRAAARVLGIRGVRLLGYADGAVDQVDSAVAIAAITRHIRQLQPQVVVTFGPDGATGHPDHIAISQFTTAAIVCAADLSYQAAHNWPSHRVSKFYYLATSRERLAAYDAVFGESAMTVDGVKRSISGWPSWAITTHIDSAAYWRQVWQAIGCHQSQLPGYVALAQLPEAQHRELWGVQEFFRVFSLAQSGAGVEQDVFAGLSSDMNARNVG
jgi:LmbE family N-acetylglucosaminyl deacetylase